jgi:hypothetical membrane protein
MRAFSIICGVASLAILLVASVGGGLIYPGYNHLTQYISELGASGATTGPAVSLAFIASGVLLALFWLSAITQFPRKPLTVVGFCLSALNGLGLMFGGVFPCDFECSLTGASASAVLHDVLGGLGYLCGIAGAALIAISARGWAQHRHLYGLGIACVIPAAVAVWAIHPGYPWFGVAQRVVELGLGVFAVGVILAMTRMKPFFS